MADLYDDGIGFASDGLAFTGVVVTLGDGSGTLVTVQPSCSNGYGASCEKTCSPLCYYSGGCDIITGYCSNSKPNFVPSKSTSTRQDLKEIQSRVAHLTLQTYRVHPLSSSRRLVRPTVAVTV